MKKELNPAQINPVKKITKPVLQELRKRINDALAEIATEYGLDHLRVGNSSYNDLDFSFKLTGAVKSEGNELATANNETTSRMLGYNKNVVGIEFDYNGYKWVITGFNLRKAKHPFKVKRVTDNKMFEFPNMMRLPFVDQSITWTKPY
jgi:hypothetical protein